MSADRTGPSSPLPILIVLTSFLSISTTNCLADPLASSFASQMLTTPLPAPRSAEGLFTIACEPGPPEGPAAPLEDDEAAELRPELLLLRTARVILQLPHCRGGEEGSTV